MGRVSVGCRISQGENQGVDRSGAMVQERRARTRMAAAPTRTLRRLFPLLSGVGCVLFIALTPLLAWGPTHRRLQL